MLTGTSKHTTFQENHRLRRCLRLGFFLSQARKSNFFTCFRSSCCRACLLGRDADPHGLCPDLLSSFFLPLQASRLQVAAQQRETGVDTRPFFSLSCHTFRCPELNQIPVSHMDERERGKVQSITLQLFPATFSLPAAIPFQVPGDASLCFERSCGGKNQ